MSMCRAKSYKVAILSGMFLYTLAGIPTTSYAEVTSSGLNTTVNETTGGVYDITGGTRPNNGTNLFHSFGDFSVDPAQSAVFTNDTGKATNNIISRVNGGNPSNILGVIDSTDFGSANMILMNPAGILFGANAQINVGGSFHATTADYIKLGNNDGIFYALGDASNLTVAPPSAFGFLSSNPASIDVQTGVIDFGTGQITNVLQVPEGETLSFVGGTINVGAPTGSPPAGFVLASLGRINLVSVASEGEAIFDGIGFNVDGFTSLGDINVTGNSLIDAREIFIRGGQLTLDGGTLFSGVFALSGFLDPAIASPDGGEINIEVSGSVTMIGHAPILAPTGIQTYAGSASGPQPGAVPDITIKADTLYMTDGAQVAAERLGDGMAADISIDANSVELRNGSAIINQNKFAGPGGTITVNAPNVVLDSAGNTAGFTGINAVSDFYPVYDGSAPYFPVFQFADSAAITVTATDTLSVLGSAQINSDSFSFGNAGNVTINAGDMLLVGEGTNTGLIGSQSTFAGNSGDVIVNASGTIDMQNGFRISANTFGSGDAGSVSVTAGQSITMSGLRTQISSSAEKPSDAQLDSFALRFALVFGPSVTDYSSLLTTLGIPPGPVDLMQVLEVLSTIPGGPGDTKLVAVTDFTAGNGSTVSVTTPNLVISADARIETSTAWDGNAGNVLVNVDALLLDGGASIRSNSGGLLLDGSVVAGTGSGGQIDVKATDTITITGGSPTTGDGSFISTKTFGDGNGGGILLSARNKVEINNGGVVSADSLAQVGSGNGNAGNITVNSDNEIELSQGAISTRAVKADGGNINLIAPKLTMQGNSSISASSQGAGQAGKISVDSTDISLVSSSITSQAEGAGAGGEIALTASNSITLENGASVSASSLGDGTAGNISLDTGTLGLITSNINSETEGAGAGGNINVVASNSVTMDSGSSISASSQGEGFAGDISIDAGNVLEMNNSSISTKATVSDGGDIEIKAIEMVYLDQSEITTSVGTGSGNGGNIDIDPEFVILKQSSILAQAHGGDGGSITIVTDNYITSEDSIVSASSALGVDGTVEISSPESTVSDDLAVLPDSYLDVTSLIGERCGTNTGSSSLVDAGPGGRAVDPDGYLPSFAANINYNNEEKNGEKSASNGNRWWATYAQQPTLQVAQMTCTF